MSYLSQEILACKPALLAKFLWYDTQCAHIGIVLTTAALKHISVVKSKLLACSCICCIIYDEYCFLAIFTDFFTSVLGVHPNSSCQSKYLYLKKIFCCLSLDLTIDIEFSSFSIVIILYIPFFSFAISLWQYL